MPLRDDSDNLLYGVDPAWIGEVLSVWLYKGDEAEKVVMPREPSAEYTNHLRWLANAVKPVNETSNHYFKTIPTGMFWTLEDIASHKVSFGDVPTDVSVGDPVRRSDVMDMYDWMADVKYYQHYENSLAEQSISYITPSQGFTGAYWADPDVRVIYSPLRNEIYAYHWVYGHYESGDPWEYMEGGYWYRRYANPFTITVTLPLAAQYFKSVAAFVRVKADTSISDYKHIPVSSVSMSSSPDGITISARCTPTVLVSTIDIKEKPYTTGKTDYYDLHIFVDALCIFLEFADDYRHP